MPTAAEPVTSNLTGLQRDTTAVFCSYSQIFAVLRMYYYWWNHQWLFKTKKKKFLNLKNDLYRGEIFSLYSQIIFILRQRFIKLQAHWAFSHMSLPASVRTGTVGLLAVFIPQLPPLLCTTHSVSSLNVWQLQNDLLFPTLCKQQVPEPGVTHKRPKDKSTNEKTLENGFNWCGNVVIQQNGHESQYISIWEMRNQQEHNKS